MIAAPTGAQGFGRSGVWRATPPKLRPSTARDRQRCVSSASTSRVRDGHRRGASAEAFAVGCRPERAHGRRRRRRLLPSRCSSGAGARRALLSLARLSREQPIERCGGDCSPSSRSGREQARCSMHARAWSSRSLATSAFKRRRRWAAGCGWNVGAHDRELLGHTRPRAPTASRPAGPPGRRPPCRRMMRVAIRVMGRVRCRLARRS